MNFKNKIGWSGIIEAIRNNHTHVVEWLCNHKADLNFLDKDGLLPIDHASVFNTKIRTAIQNVMNTYHNPIKAESSE